jgi:predicted transport protein
VNDYTIEHIMPQNENLSTEWRQALGVDWERVQKTWLHTLGNLTLTGYNSEYSDRPFVEKRDMNGGFKESPLLLNKELGAVEAWNEEAIIRRAEQLATRAVQVWTFPTISKDVLKKYEPEKSVKTTYSVEDHQYLSGSSEMYGTLTKDLFEAIRKEILALDPAVTEEFLKLYVAYKAEVNFVDIIPRAQGIILSINMKGEEIVDPRGLCKDVSQQGHWGNGAYEMKLEAAEDIPYAMGLIRQALELQLGSE